MAWINSFEGLLDFLSIVIVHAPDGFPREDYLRDDEQLTLDMAFAELNDSMRFVERKIGSASLLKELKSILDMSLAAYRQGDDIKGAHLLQDFERLLLENNE